MPVKNNGPGALGRPAMTRKSKIDPEYPQWAESKMRAIENRRLKELRTVVRESMPEIMSIIAEEQETGPESIRHDGDSDMVRRIQNRFRIMRDRLSRRLKTDPLERDVRRCADYTDRRQLKEWQRSVRATLGIDIHDDFFLGERYDLMLKRWVEQNVSFITSIESGYFDDMESIVTDERYKFIQKVVSSSVKKGKDKMTVSDKIDQIVTNRILGIPIFIAIMWVVYYISVTTVGTVVTDWTNDTFVGAIQEAAGTFLTNAGASDFIISLAVDGVIGGLGAVLGFMPQMAILFLFLSILEDCGYMVRIAFVMDRVFRHFGLSGKSFIPLLISSGCGIPGIMASKTIEQDNDRRLTIMTATFVPCGAKLPVIALMGGVMAGYVTGWDIAGFITPLMYFVGIVAVLVAAIMLKKTKPFSGKPAPFVMELPQYHIPSARTVLLHVWERLKGFFIKAGTVLSLACVVMWILSTFGVQDGAFGMVEDSADSLMAIVGGAIAPLFAPLGWGEWQPVAAAISGFSAKEGIVSTMGVLANVAGDVEDADTVAAGVGMWFPTALAGFSFLLFNLLDSPCLAAISTMAKEMQSRKWFWFAIVFQNVFAYAVTLVVYQIGSFLLYGTFGAWTVIAFAVLLFMLFMLFRPDPYKDQKTYAKRSVQAAS